MANRCVALAMGQLGLRLSRRGSTGPRVSFFFAVGAGPPGQPGARACRRVIAAPVWVAQGQVAARRSRSRLGSTWSLSQSASTYPCRR